MQRTLGIDLGTTNSVMAYMTHGEPKMIINRENFSELTPSVVGLGRRGKLLVGKAAKAGIVKSPHNTISSVKRFMGRKFADSDVQKALERVGYRVTEAEGGDVSIWMGEYEYSPTEISALILRRLKEEAENQLNESFTRAVITVPAYFGERQVAATREAGEMAGFHVLRIINEPTAAALAYGSSDASASEGKVILVYDLGGGTFDISILMLTPGSFTVMGIEGDNLLGGDDFDYQLTKRLLDEVRQQEGVDLSADKRALVTISREAENIKISLSGQEEVDLFLPALGREAVDLELDISRSEFEQMIRQKLENTIELTHKAIREAHLTPDLIDQILLVGGSTAIPLVEELLKEVFGEEKIHKNIHPMHCVALGAAIQSALITEIECEQCQNKNSVHRDECAHCGEALYGSDKVMCPTCYTLSDASQSSCFRCQNALTDHPQPKKPPKAKAALKPCPKCHKPNRAGATFCSGCREALVDIPGRACPDCKHVNIQGAKRCSRCQKDMAVEVFDITPKDLGIELHDGRMSVIIPKNTNYPTIEPLSRDFSTVVAGQRRLEVPVFEGPEEMAQQNEMCGLVTMSLPEGLPRGTPVNIAFGLNSDRTITITVKVRSANEEAKKIRLQRNQIDPEQRRQIEEQRERVTRFMDRWAEELYEAESKKFYQMLERLDRVLNEGPTRGQPLDSLLSEIDQSVELVKGVRGTDAFISAVLSSGGKYLRETQREELMEMQHKLVQEREQGNWTAAEAIANHATEEINQFGGPILLIVHCRTLANQNKLSAPLRNRVYAALRLVDEAAERNNKNQLTQGINNLFEMWPEIIQELEALGQPAPAITKLQG